MTGSYSNHHDSKGAAEPVVDELALALRSAMVRTAGITASPMLMDALLEAAMPAVANTWAEAYRRGVEDHATSLDYSSDDFGIPGGHPVGPARNNPHGKYLPRYCWSVLRTHGWHQEADRSPQSSREPPMCQSIHNQVAARMTPDVPKVGMGATELLATDRRAGTIIAISHDGRQLTFQRDKAKRTDRNGRSDDQSYDYERNPGANKRVYTRRKNGQWCLKGTEMGRAVLAVGYRKEYHDYSF